MNSLYILNGWGVNESVLEPLQQHLAELMPCKVINLRDYHQSSLALSLAYLKQNIPKQSLVIGWSLGGMLAIQLAAVHPLKAIVCLGSNPSFVANTTWPTAMSQVQFTRFYQNTLTAPESNLKHFLRLCVHGDKQLRTLSTTWIDTNLSHQAQIWGLDMLQTINNTHLLNQLPTPQLHVFAEHDALVSSQAQELLAYQHPLICSHILPSASHAFPFSHAQAVFQLTQSFIMSL